MLSTGPYEYFGVAFCKAGVENPFSNDQVFISFFFSASLNRHRTVAARITRLTKQSGSVKFRIAVIALVAVK